MKHLKSSLKDLRHLFDKAITAREVAEPLISFDAGHDIPSVKRFMEKRSFDVVGAREGGVTVGYIRLDELSGEAVRDHIVRFEDGEPVPENASLSDVIHSLKNRDAVFVDFLGQVGGIITRGDLQKAPVRMWLFGLVSMIEMQMLRVIRERFHNSEWSQMLSRDRLSMAEEMYENRVTRNEETDLSDCLQWGDKATILLKDESTRSAMGINRSKEGKRLFKKLQDLRNDLAHSQDIIKSHWPELADLVRRAESLLENLEMASFDLVRVETISGDE